MTLTGYARPAYVTFATEWDDGAESLTANQTAVAALWNTHIVPRVDSNVTTSLIRSHGTGAGGVDYLSETPLAYVGGTVGETTPLNVVLLVKKIIGFVGRANRGRMYVPWVGIESSVDESGQINAGAVTNFQTSFSALFAALVGRANPTDPALLHTYLPPQVPPLATFLTGFSVDPRIATQRRRLR